MRVLAGLLILTVLLSACGATSTPTLYIATFPSRTPTNTPRTSPTATRTHVPLENAYTPTPATVATAVRAAAVPLSAGAAPTSAAIRPTTAGVNASCRQYGSTVACASVSHGSPAQSTTVTVFGQLVKDGAPVAGQPMRTAWHYKSTTSYCEGSTDANGLASCSRDIGGASKGFEVEIDVSIGGYTSTTSFTTK